MVHLLVASSYGFKAVKDQFFSFRMVKNPVLIIMFFYDSYYSKKGLIDGDRDMERVAELDHFACKHLHL
ncbi:MAG: hypothetical protein AMK69_19680, partial [Nitrospira bacterium SG8_3]